MVRQHQKIPGTLQKESTAEITSRVYGRKIDYSIHMCRLISSEEKGCRNLVQRFDIGLSLEHVLQKR